MIRVRTREAAPRGQSMMEAIIAIGILITAVASALTLLQSSVSAEKDSESKIIGANLAREGIEIVRAIRDSNWLADRAWDDGLEGPSFDYTAIPVFDPENVVWAFDFVPDFIDSSETHVYRHNGAVLGSTVGLFVQAVDQPEDTLPTLFRRLVTIDAVCDDTFGGYEVKVSSQGCGSLDKIAIRVRSIVRWSVSNRPKTEIAETMMFNWR